MYILNTNPHIPKCTSEDGTHKFIETKKPEDNYSGWHESKCAICGIELGYDSSD